MRKVTEWTTTSIEEKLINHLMKNGKKSVARKIYENTLKEIKLSGHMNPAVVVQSAIENASPNLMIKSKRIGGAVYQIPVEVRPVKKIFFAIKWILDAARAKGGKPMYKKLAEEIIAAYGNQGAAVKKKEEAQRVAEANKAFAYMAKYVN